VAVVVVVVSLIAFGAIALVAYKLRASRTEHHSFNNVVVPPGEGEGGDQIEMEVAISPSPSSNSQVYEDDVGEM